MMSGNDKENNGYGKPPKSHRWKKGQSGNPRGRPKKKDRSPAQIIADIYNEEVTVTLKGRTVKLSQFELAVRNVVNKTQKSGSVRDLKALLQLMDEYGLSPADLQADQARKAKEQSQAVYDKIVEVFDRTKGVTPEMIEKKELQLKRRREEGRSPPKQED
jgi:hypothetical protein|tara:strand:- start:39647 stop:40126 length:480 start_codon:yes stop_codon:yes gene_type:complete